MALLTAARRASSLPLLRRGSSALLRPVASPVPAIRRSSSSSIRDAKIALVTATTDISKAEHGSRAFAAALDSVRAATESLTNSTFDLQLSRAIDSAIKSSDHTRKLEESAGCFPFEISENDWCKSTLETYVTLKRTFEGEQIDVKVYIPNKDVKSFSSSCDMSPEDGKGGKNASRSTIHLKVTVSKSNGSKLEFTCDAYPDDIIIRSIGILQADQSLLDGMFAYDGFTKLDENLHKSFHKYLERRGITPTTINSLREYMSRSEPGKHQLWLNKLSDFVKKD